MLLVLGKKTEICKISFIGFTGFQQQIKFGFRLLIFQIIERRIILS